MELLPTQQTSFQQIRLTEKYSFIETLFRVEAIVTHQFTKSLHELDNVNYKKFSNNLIIRILFPAK